MRVLGLEPRTYALKERCSKIISHADKELTKTENLVFDTSLDKIVQKDPELVKLINAWPELPEHIKTAIKALIHSSLIDGGK